MLLPFYWSKRKDEVPMWLIKLIYFIIFLIRLNPLPQVLNFEIISKLLVLIVSIRPFTPPLVLNIFIKIFT
jgi:hypothetical protein